MSKIYLLNNSKFNGAENLEVFRIEYIQNDISLKNYDALIFTSKNAVYSLNSFNKDWKEISSYAIAPQTAKIIEEEGGKVEFIGTSGHANEFANELIKDLKNKKVLYVRALKVVSNLSKILKKKGIEVDEIITYKTVCNNDLDRKLEEGSKIIFTSPSSVKCFFKNYSWNDSFMAIAIGQTTANYLPKSINFKISSETSIEECIKLAQNLKF